MATRQFTAGQLIRRSFTPSPSSGFLCVVIGLALAAVHVVLSSVDFGTALPGVLDGQWAVAYTDHVVRPLSAFFANATLNKLIVAALWGVVGLSIYMGFEYGIHSYQMLQESRRQVALNSYGGWNRQAAQRNFLRAMTWRLGVIVLAVVFFVAMQPLFRYALGVAPHVVAGPDLRQDGIQVLLAGAVWALFCHGCVVIVRLYTQRTRIFGDEKLY